MITGHTLRVFLLALIIFLSSLPVASKARSETPLDQPLSDPVFVHVPNLSGMVIEGQTPIYLTFNYDYDRCRAVYGDNKYYEGCRRHLGLEGRSAADGITMSPSLAGHWTWYSDYDLSFTPSEPWRAGEAVTVTLDLDAMGVPANVVFNDRDRIASFAFQTAPLNVTFPVMNFMQDPVNPDRRLVNARLALNYPVEMEMLQKNLHAVMEAAEEGQIATAGDQQFDIEFTPDGDQSANVAILLKSLPEQEQALRLVASSGIPPKAGGKATAADFSERTRIPTKESWLAFNDISTAIARSEDGTPQQVLSLETNTNVLPSDVFKNVSLYLLPEQHPVTKNVKKDAKPYEWKAANEISPEILKLSTVVKPEPMKGKDANTTLFAFPFSAPEGRYLYVVLKDGMKAFGGYTLGGKVERILKVPDWPNDLKIEQEGSILTLSGARKLSLHARGTDRLAVEVAHIRTEALQHFISQTSGDIRTPSFQNWSFGKDDIAVIDSQNLPMNYVSPQDSQYAAFDFTSYMKEGKKGLFLLSIQGYRNDKTAGDPQQRFVMVTDLGLIVKQNANHTRDIYLVSFTSGKPVDNAVVSVLGRNGLSVFDGKTDGQGHLILPDQTAFGRDRAPVAIIAQKGNDFTFIPYDRADRIMNVSRFDVGGNVIAAKGLNAMLFSDRGIYRPGETAHIAALVRNADWTPLPEGLPLQLVITDPRGRIAKDIILNFSSSGLESLDFATEETSPTGTYRANLHISEDGQPGSHLGGTSFKVEDFQPDRLKIKTLFTPALTKGWVKPDALAANVELTNLYGTAATDRRISSTVTLHPAELHFDRYAEYRFYDSHPAKPRTIEYKLPDTKTDSDGKAALPLNLDKQDAATYSLNLETRGYDAGGGRGVTAYSSILVSPMDYVIGHMTEANLGYLRKGQKYELGLIAIDPDLEPRDVPDLTKELIRIDYVSSLVRSGDGSYIYESVPREELIVSESFRLASAGTVLPLPANDIGTFTYRIKNAQGRILSDIPFTVAGAGQRESGKDREAVLNIAIDKDRYGPGEEIELNITAPYTGAGLITLESDKVIAQKWFQADKTDIVQKISIPGTFSGKGYISVAFVRDINSREIYLSPLSYAVVPFIANTEQRTADITLDAPSIVKPGESVTVSYRGDSKGKAILYAVDEGILQVARYETPDPLDFFLLNRALQVATAQMLDLLMPEFDLVRKLSAKGGDAAAEQAAMGKHLNPFRRKTLAPAVFWSGIVDLDTDNKSVTFTPPGHFNGQMRLMAVAVTDSGVGSAEQAITVQGDIIVTPNTPLFMAPGDVAEASVTITNNMKDSGPDAAITLTPRVEGGIEIIEAPEKDIIIAEGTERTFTFTLRAADTPGPASLFIDTGIGDIRQSAEATLSIRPGMPKETSLLTGYAEDGKAAFQSDRVLYPAFAERNLALSTLPSAYIFGLVRYLDGFPYGCTEQLVSQAWPQLALRGAPEFGSNDADIKEKMAQAVETLRQRQTPDGGFSQWLGANQAEDFISVYSTDFLLQAQQTGIPVPSEMTENALRHIRNWVNRSITSVSDARNRAYGIYVLTRSGIVTTNEILHLLKYYNDTKNAEWKTDLAAVYLAASYQMMQQGDLAQKTLSEFENGTFAGEMTYTNRDWEDQFYNPFVKYAQYINLTSRHFPESLKTIDKNIIFSLARFLKEDRYNTLSAALGIQALRAYAAILDNEIKPEDIRLELDGKPAKLEMKTLAISQIPVETKSVSIDAGKSALFYTLTETGFNRIINGQPMENNLTISRKYFTLDGKPLSDDIAVGDVIEAVITISSHGGRLVDNVAIVDLLPGGFEAEPAENSQNGSLATRFVDRREDRIIAFGTVAPHDQEFRYRLRAVSKGTFFVPAPFAESMYDLTTRARGEAGEITVIDPH